MYVSIYWIYDQHQPTMWYGDRRGVELTNKYGDIHVGKTSIWLVIYPKHSQTIYPYKHSNSNSPQTSPYYMSGGENYTTCLSKRHKQQPLRYCIAATNNQLDKLMVWGHSTSKRPNQSQWLESNARFLPYDSKQTKWAVFNSANKIPVGSNNYIYIYLLNHMIIPSRFQ